MMYRGSCKDIRVRPGGGLLDSDPDADRVIQLA
jgi:hypothetical protein